MAAILSIAAISMMGTQNAYAEDELTLAEDLETAQELFDLQGRTTSLNLGIMAGYIPLGPPVGTSDTLPDGATRQWPIYAWLQTTTPLLLTRYSASFGIETESTIGVSFTPDSEEEKFLNVSTQGMFNLTTFTWDTFFTTFFAGAGLQRGQPHWWRERDRFIVNGSFGVRLNVPDDEGTAEMGYAYEPTISTLRDVTVGGDVSLGPATHVAHRVWLAFEPVFVLTYVHDVVHYEDFIDEAWVGHRFLFTFHVL